MSNVGGGAKRKRFDESVSGNDPLNSSSADGPKKKKQRVNSSETYDQSKPEYFISEEQDLQVIREHKRSLIAKVRALDKQLKDSQTTTKESQAQKIKSDIALSTVYRYWNDLELTLESWIEKNDPILHGDNSSSHEGHGMNNLIGNENLANEKKGIEFELEKRCEKTGHFLTSIYNAIQSSKCGNSSAPIVNELKRDNNSLQAEIQKLKQDYFSLSKQLEEEQSSRKKLEEELNELKFDRNLMQESKEKWKLRTKELEEEKKRRAAISIASPTSSSATGFDAASPTGTISNAPVPAQSSAPETKTPEPPSNSVDVKILVETKAELEAKNKLLEERNKIIANKDDKINELAQKIRSLELEKDVNTPKNDVQSLKIRELDAQLQGERQRVIFLNQENLSLKTKSEENEAKLKAEFEYMKRGYEDMMKTRIQAMERDLQKYSYMWNPNSQSASASSQTNVTDIVVTPTSATTAGPFAAQLLSNIQQQSGNSGPPTPSSANSPTYNGSFPPGTPSSTSQSSFIAGKKPTPAPSSGSATPSTMVGTSSSNDTNGLKGEVKLLRGKYENLKKTWSEKCKRVTELEDSCKKFKEKETQLLNKIKVLEADSKVEQLTKQIEQKESKISFLSQQLNEISSLVSKTENEKSRFDEEKKKFEDDKTVLIRERIERDNQLNIVKKEKQHLEMMLSNLKNQISEKDKLYAQTKEELASKENETSACIKEAMKYRTEFERVRGSFEKLQLDFLVLKKDYEALTEKFNTELLAKDKSISEFEQRLKDEEGKKKVFAEKLERLKAAGFGVSAEEGNLSDQQQEIEHLSSLLNCSLCKVEKKSVLITKCGHCYCKGCIETSLASRNRDCPVCRKKFQKSDVVDIFLDA